MSINKNISHYIVAGAAWDEDMSLRRLQGLAEYLRRDPKTSDVYWIFPSGIGFRRPLQDYKKLNRRSERLANNIYQIALPDNRGWIRFGKILRRYIKKQILKLIGPGKENYLWYTTPSFDALSELNVWQKVIYDCNDLWTGPPLNRKRISSEKKIAFHSDVIFTCSRYLEENIKVLYNLNSILIENGVDFDLFSQSKTVKLDGIGKPRFGFIGGMKRNIDFNILRYIAETNQKFNIILIGPISLYNQDKFYEVIRNPNIHYLGVVDYQKVPEYVKALDVGLLPYNDDPFNKGVFPLKFFEYLAAGIPVVGSGVRNTKKYIEEGVYYYAESSPDFLNFCLRAIAEKDNEKFIRRRKQVAKQQDWAKKFEKMWSIVYDNGINNHEY